VNDSTTLDSASPDYSGASETQSAEQKQLVRAIRLGFAVVLGLTVILGGMGLYQLNSVNASMSKIVTVNNSKIALASAMRDAIRLRALSINKMLATQDYFKRDAELLKFYEYAGDYRQAREQLIAMGMDRREKTIIETLRKHTKAAQPLVRRAAELLMDGERNEEFNRTIDQAMNKQEELLVLLDDSIELQKEYANQALDAARRQFEYTMASFVVVLAVLLTIGIVIARVVVHYAASKNKALAVKNLELQKARAKADETTRAKSEFLANMSHEIRTPLTSIIGFSESLVGADLSAQERRRAILAIRNSGRHLFDIINDVLDISKIEAGKLEMEAIEVSPVDLVKETVCIVEQKAIERGLQLRTHFDLPLPKTIISDPMRLKQILLNLCGNAVKFTPSGSITVCLGFDASSRQMLFSVTDTGIGMTRDQVEHVFAPFHQADKTTSRYYGGTGLGLSISKQLAKNLGGDITCHSEVGKGTRFTLSIAANETGDLQWIEEVDTQAENCAQSASSVATPTLCGRVLLAEDMPDIQTLITLLMKKAGLDVKAVDNGADALQQASRGRYDLVVMDMQMPVMDGVEAIQQLRQSGFDQPIVALTANATQEDKNRCIQAGADNYVTKPVDVAIFYNILSQYLPEQPQQSATPSEHTPHEATLIEAPPREESTRAADITALDEEMQHMINSFINRLPDTVQEITTYYREKQWRELAVSAHRLKGAGGAFGFPELSEISEQIMLHSRLSARQSQRDGLQELEQDDAQEHTQEGLPEDMEENTPPQVDMPQLIERLNHRCRQITKKAG
jgi:signal transduction histidine kinase/CheY-like chemotaxis protein/HPt (histidine-containing phosphotransfer) domain-containing protein